MFLVVAPWQPWPVLVVAVVGALALVVLSVTRVGGRWLYEIALLGLRFLFRARRHDLTGSNGNAAALLDLLLPGSTVRTVDTGQGPVMAVSHPGGVTAIVRPRIGTPALLSSLPSPAALLPGSGDLPHRFGIQTVFQTGGRAGTPVGVWLAVHVTRTVETPTDDELILALRNGLRRVRSALRRAGVPVEPLPEGAASDTIAWLAHANGRLTELREDWRFWRTGKISQACFTVDSNGLNLGARRIGTLLTSTPGVAVTVTFAARSGADGVADSGLLRLAATTEAAIETAANRLSLLLAPTGVHLTRLDGAHLSGVAASLPIGGFLR